MINLTTDEQRNMSQDELLMVENQYWAGMWESLERLEKNPDFKKVILDGYFKDKAINGVSMLATSYVKQNGKRGDVIESLNAISELQDYFITIESMGRAPEEDEEEDQAED